MLEIIANSAVPLRLEIFVLESCSLKVSPHKKFFLQIKNRNIMQLIFFTIKKNPL